jgi:multiple sugar transport system permease protein
MREQSLPAGRRVPRDTAHVVASPRTAKRLRGLARGLFMHVLLLSTSALLLLPLFWMMSTGLKTAGQEWTFPPKFLPDPVHWQNYLEAMAYLPVPFYRSVINTLIVTIGATLGTMMSCTLAAFSFARLRYRGRDFMFGLVLATMMLPGVVTLIPTFLIFKVLGWLDTFLPLIVPYWLGSSAFSIFLMRQFFMTIPPELDEAARIDGASSLSILWNVVLPLSGPVLTTVVIFQTLWRWNDFMEPMLYLSNMQNYTVALALRTFSNVHSPHINYMMALASLQVIPVIILFFFAQRYFVRGITLTGLSGR